MLLDIFCGLWRNISNFGSRPSESSFDVKHLLETCVFLEHTAHLFTAVTACIDWKYRQHWFWIQQDTRSYKELKTGFKMAKIFCAELMSGITEDVETCIKSTLIRYLIRKLRRTELPVLE